MFVLSGGEMQIGDLFRFPLIHRGRVDAICARDMVFHGPANMLLSFGAEECSWLFGSLQTGLVPAEPWATAAEKEPLFFSDSYFLRCIFINVSLSTRGLSENEREQRLAVARSASKDLREPCPGWRSQPPRYSRVSPLAELARRSVRSREATG